jgi:copper(I)-binding protein
MSNVYAAKTITVSDGYVKASIPGSDVTASYMTLRNTSNKAITLQKVSSTVSDRIEIHEHSMADGMMRMRKVGEITIKANSTVVLQPSGLHLMIFSLKQPIKEKSVMPLTLYFSNDTEVKIQLPVLKYK